MRSRERAAGAGTILVAGALANKPANGGEAWVRLSWVSGFARLGYRTFFIEEIAADACTDEDGRPASFADSVNRSWFEAVTAAFGLSERAALIVDGGEQVYGATWDRVLEWAEDADLLVNIGGHLTLPELRSRIHRSAYVDIDPGFVQFWQDQGIAGARLDGHDVHFTIGENIGAPDCPIPTVGIDWLPIRQPVVLDQWPVAAGGDARRFTTVANWRGTYGPVQHNGHSYGLKVHEFRRLIDLPPRSGASFEIALGIHPADAADLEALRTHGWRIVDPRTAAAGPAEFRRYVQASGAEFSVAQGVYVGTRCGWFSDRSTRYLASGRPVLVQDTGIADHLPVGEGLLTFSTLEEAVDGVARISADYERHSRAARAVAEECFDSNRVLPRMLRASGIAC
jgi:hypothetical protein